MATANHPANTKTRPSPMSDTTATKKKNQQAARNRRRRQPRGGNGNRNPSGRPGGTSQKKPQMSDKKLSHSLSWALRHAALDIGLTIRPDGYVPVRELLESNHPKLRGVTLGAIQRVVETSDKRRFKLAELPRHLYESSPGRAKDSGAADAASTNQSGDGGSGTAPSESNDSAATTESSTILCIRANQGHSIKIIDPELLLTRLSPETLRSMPCIVHGTYPDAWESIKRPDGGGLRKMNRTHIHFASGLPKDDGVISGMRKNCGIYIFLDASRCADDDESLAFYTSDNGVILTSGIGGTGVLPIKYFSHVTNSAGRILLDNRSGTSTS